MLPLDDSEFGMRVPVGKTVVTVATVVPPEVVYVVVRVKVVKTVDV